MRVRNKHFECYRVEWYATGFVDVSNKTFFPCTGCHVILCFSIFSRKLWIVFLNFSIILTSPNEDSLQSFWRSFWDNQYFAVEKNVQ